MELTNHFKKFLSIIEPPQTYVEDASMGHNTLRDRLEADTGIAGYIIDTFLSGSYARNTATTPIKDVDVIVVLNLDIESYKPKDILVSLHKILNKYYPGRTIRQYRSIKVVLKYVKMDVVPAIGLDSNSSLYIPEYSPLQQRWILAHPKGHIELVTDLNKKNLSKIKN